VTKIVACTLLALAVCAGTSGLASAQSDASRAEILRLDAERQTCSARIIASPEMRALGPKVTTAPNIVPTPTEAADMDRLHRVYMKPCWDIELGICRLTHPSLALFCNSAAATNEAAVAQLVRREITWREYDRIVLEFRLELNRRLKAAQAQLGLPSLNGLDRLGAD
jgi:hypothetical protein